MSIQITSFGADGVNRSRILVAWTPPADAYVKLIEIQYKKETEAKWTGHTTVDPKVDHVFIGGVSDGEVYSVRLRSINVAGVASAWVESDPVTASGAPSEIGPSSLLGVLKIANNLSDLADVPTARTNLGLGTAAIHAEEDFDVAGAAAAVLASSLQAANNLSDLADASTARTNLGLGAAALLSVPVPIVSGGTDGTTALDARTNLEVPGLHDANIYDALNTYEAGAIYKTAPGIAQLIIDGTTSLQQVVMQIFDDGVSKWLFGKQADNSFFVFDQVQGRNLMATDATTGALTIEAPTTVLAEFIVATAGSLTDIVQKSITFFDASASAAVIAAADTTSTLNALEITKAAAVVSVNFPNGPVTVQAGFLGVNTVAPASPLHVVTALTTQQNGITLEEIGPTSFPKFTFYKNRGSRSSPSPVLLNDALGSFSFAGYDDSLDLPNAIRGASFAAFAEENWTPTAHGSRVSISVCALGSSALLAAISIASTRLVTFGAGITVPGTATFTVAPVFTDASGSRTALGLTGAATMTLPVSLANGGTNAITAAAARVSLAVAGISDNNAFTGSNSITNGGFTMTRNDATATQAIVSNSGTGNASVRMQTTSGNTTGTAFVDYLLSGLIEWISGVDRTSSQFRITSGSVFAGTDPFAISTAGRTMLGSIVDNGVDRLQVTGSVSISTANCLINSSGIQVGLTAGLHTNITSNGIGFTRAASDSFIDQSGLAGTLVFRGSIAAPLDTLFATFSTTLLTFSKPASFASTLSAGGPVTFNNPSAANGALFTSLTINAGADVTLGPVTFTVRAFPSATGTLRYTALGSIDNASGAVRPLVLNTFFATTAATFGPVLVGSATDNGVDKFQVTGSAKVTGAFSSTGANTLPGGIVLTNSGSVGITITASSSASFAIQKMGNDLGDTFDLRFYGSTVVAALAGITLARWAAYFTNAGNGLLIGNLGSVPLVLMTANAERMRIMGAGDVLIGTTTDTGVDKLQVAGHIAVVTAGNGLKIKEGSNAKMGTGTLVAGTLTVANTSVTANSRIFVSSKGGGAAVGALYVSAQVAATSFTVTSLSATDTASFSWLIVEPA